MEILAAKHKLLKLQMMKCLATLASQNKIRLTTLEDKKRRLNKNSAIKNLKNRNSQFLKDLLTLDNNKLNKKIRRILVTLMSLIHK